MLLALAVAGLLAGGIHESAQAQEPEYNAPIRFGFYGGANYNFVGAGAQRLTKIDGGPTFTQPQLNDGTGIGFYFGAMGEYNSNDILGAALKLSVDDRSATLEDPDNGRKFSTRLTYVTIEPMMRFNMIAPGFHVSVGPQLAVNLAADYDYTPSTDDEITQPLKGEPLENMNNVAFGIGGDFAYDINLSRDNIGPTKWYLTPFIGASYIVDQKKSDFPNNQDTFDDTWSTVSVRAGLGVKFGAVGQ
jgi:hypothetical protein